MLKNDTVSKDAPSYMAILHDRGTMPRVGLNPAKRSIQGHPHKTSKNPSSDSKLIRTLAQTHTELPIYGSHRTGRYRTAVCRARFLGGRPVRAVSMFVDGKWTA